MRFTVRRIMVAVVTLALVLGTGIQAAKLRRRWEHCRDDASYCENMERYYSALASRYRSQGHRMTWYVEREAELFGRLRREYRYAATHPWVKMPDEPPPPPSAWE